MQCTHDGLMVSCSILSSSTPSTRAANPVPHPPHNWWQMHVHLHGSQTKSGSGSGSGKNRHYKNIYTVYRIRYIQYTIQYRYKKIYTGSGPHLPQTLWLKRTRMRSQWRSRQPSPETLRLPRHQHHRTPAWARVCVGLRWWNSMEEVRQ